MVFKAQQYSPADEKVERIKQLHNCGLNVARMLYFPKGKIHKMKLQEFLAKYSADIGLFNIRTYDWDATDKLEGWNSKHYVGLLPQDITITMDKIYTERYCMIDAEQPEHGTYAGNIVVQNNGYCNIDYYKGDGAMVRMANQAIEGDTIKEMENNILMLDELPLMGILRKILKLPRDFGRDKVFEWSIHREPCGVNATNDIWWEWRNWIPMAKEGATPSWKDV